jgi:Ca-activated chloride channel family protein
MPNNEDNQAILKDRNGHDVALKGVKVQARLRDLLAEICVEQNYLNAQKTNIEAVYTFPLPLDAVLLGFEVEIAGKMLAGQVVEKKQAERDYEDAVTDGNSAIMLEESGPGLYTVSLGNLMANDTAVIRYRYGLLLSWQGDRLRFLMPTTIAPRYGDAIAAGMQPHQIPESSLSVEYPLDLSINVEGKLAEAALSSPTHPVTCHRSDTGMVVTLAAKAMLDRDFVLVLESKQAQSTCIVTPDKTGQVAMAALRIPEAPGSEGKALAVKVVIDCSGSMAGISISQARKAALEIINQLQPHDRFNVTLFGTSYKHLFRTMVPATARYITEAWTRLETLDADLGGTEMEKALVATFGIDCGDASPNVLLITDGEIHEHQKLVGQASRSGHRVFTVGVGSSVAETFLRNLSARTGGACELVSPQEGMTERVLMQFHRMRQPKLSNLRIEWPSTPEWTSVLPDTVFAGDTVHLFAGFSATISGDVKLTVAGDSGDIEIISSMINATEAEIPRIAAAGRLRAASEQDAAKLALDYQLLSRWTNYLVIAEREDKADDLPVLQQVPQMLAAGWGGTASSISFCVDLSSVTSAARGASCASAMASSGVDKYDIPAFLRRASDDDSSDSIQESRVLFHRSSSTPRRLSERLLHAVGLRTYSSNGDVIETPAAFVTNAEGHFFTSGNNSDLPSLIDDIKPWGLPQNVIDDLRKLVSQGHSEPEVVAAFIYALTMSSIGKMIDRAVRRRILKGWKHVIPGQALDAAMLQSLALISGEEWNWTVIAIREEVLP